MTASKSLLPGTIFVVTIKSVDIFYDDAKNERNIESRGLSFDLVEYLDWSSALIIPDERKDYGEVRLKVFAFLLGRLHVTVVTPRSEGLRVISLRKANTRERKFYEKETA